MSPNRLIALSVVLDAACGFGGYILALLLWLRGLPAYNLHAFTALSPFIVLAYVSAAWAIREGALFFGGMPYTYLFKSVILGFTVLLAVQAIAIALRCVAVLGGERVDVFETTGEAD